MAQALGPIGPPRFKIGPIALISLLLRLRRLGGGGGGAQAKENDVKKALKKYEGVLKVKGSWARKESKKGESMVSVLTPLPRQASGEEGVCGGD